MREGVSLAGPLPAGRMYIPATEQLGGAHEVRCPHPDAEGRVITKAIARGNIFSVLSDICGSCGKCNLPSV